MDRRAFIAAVACSALVLPRVRAQQSKQVYRVGILDPYRASDPHNDLIRRTIAGVGYVEGKEVVIEWRYADDQTTRLPALAADLARLKLDAIIAIGDPAIRAARQATPTIPIIAGSDDLAGEGRVKNLARPEGNVTGVSSLAAELNAKRLELLHTAVPSAKRIAILWDPATGSFHLASLHAVARQLGVNLSIQEVRRPADLNSTFEAVRAWRADALNTLASPLLHAMRSSIIEAAARYRLPAIYQWDNSAREGGLMAYGPSRAEVLLKMSVQLDRVLKGAKPADIPVEQPTKFELVINLKTAKALGVTIPQSLLLRADEVIQ